MGASGMPHFKCSAVTYTSGYQIELLNHEAFLSLHKAIDTIV